MTPVAVIKTKADVVARFGLAPGEIALCGALLSACPPTYMRTPPADALHIASAYRDFSRRSSDHGSN